MQDEEARKTKQWFERHGLAPPKTTSHGVKQDDLGEKLKPPNIRSWRLEGNRLVAKTDLGEVVNYIDPNVVMTGVDSNNRPVFKRINNAHGNK